MRERLERFASFPFTASCVSHSSLDVLDTHPRRPTAGQPPPLLPIADAEEREVKLKGANISAGIQKAVMKGIRSFSQLFTEREDEDVEIEIGFPTDVQHVAHIGLEGSTASGMFSGAPVSLRQFELAVSHA
ncbi:hypothetical protein HPP92_009759 [Vanilla planifolia]|uniref:CRIB domain-containing protein n=1 Tax=Vanilla planifolia TaxID=51239 RepID=A0A835REV8_VANPL|nr:hypothetical protein HPP92_009970 [Vanilla planifolia]KAG0487661.1 hypothetical protein HPP92_009756 [Vanilla planifolia]KAG0487664.1 hypothetical protein HPP92_009759 [Vanilla planifolia]